MDILQHPDLFKFFIIAALVLSIFVPLCGRRSDD